MALTESDITKVVTKPAIAPTDTFLFNQGGTGPFQVSYNAVVSALQASLDSRYAAKGTTGSLTLGGVLGTANVITDQTTTVITNVTTVASNASSSNPVTAPRTGLRTFNIHNVAELDALPMGSLQAGDVVNIFYNATPYNRIVRISNQGTAAQPIVIWGVTDANGNRPVFTGKDARTTPGSMPGGTGNVWNNTSTLSWQYREGIAIMGTACKASDPWGTYRPEYVQFYNFELTGAHRGNFYYGNDGVMHEWDWSDGYEASGFRVQEGAYIIAENMVIYDCDFGYFTQTYNDIANYAPYKCVLRNSRIYGCGRVGRATEHNVYVQGIQPVLENNFFGPNRIGSQGSTVKLRAAGFVVRANWMMSSDGRMLDLVHTESNDNGVKIDPTYGYGHVYGNVMTNIWSSSVVGSVMPIHIGGDNCGEDGPATFWLQGVEYPQPTLTDADLTTHYRDANGVIIRSVVAKYLHTVYFYDNTIVMKSDGGQKWRCCVFDLSLSGTATNPRTTVWEWNNAIRLIGTTYWSKLKNAGHINHMGGSTWDADVGLNASGDTALASRYSFSGTARQAALNLTADTWIPTAQTASNVRLAVPPSGLPSSFDSTLVANYQIAGPINSVYSRTATSVGALDIVSTTTVTTPVSTPTTTTTLVAAPSITTDSTVKDDTAFALLNGTKKAVAAFSVGYTSGCTALSFEALISVMDSSGVKQTLQQRIDVLVSVIGGVVSAKAQTQLGLSNCVSGTLTLTAEAIAYTNTINLCLTPTSSLAGVTVSGYVALSTCLGSAVTGLALLS